MFTRWVAGSASSGFPSRRLRPAGPRLPGPGGAPHRTNDLDQAGAVWLPAVRGGRATVRPGIPERPGPGRAALAAGGWSRVVGPEALPAGGTDHAPPARRSLGQLAYRVGVASSMGLRHGRRGRYVTRSGARLGPFRHGRRRLASRASRPP
jgi:hypothetical protein